MGVEDGSDLAHSWDMYDEWSDNAINIHGTDKSVAATRNRVIRAVLAAVPPPHISEVLVLVEKS